MDTNQASDSSDGDFIQYMASINSTQNGVINIDSSASDDEEVEIVKEMTVITEDHKCDLCNEGEFLIDKLLRFGGLINEKYKFVCDKCDTNFELKSKLKEHSSKCKGPDCPQIAVNNSSESTNPATVPNSNVLNLDERRPKICKICLHFFKSQSGLTKHMNTRHSGVIHTCEVCKATFSNFQQFRQHCFEHQMQCRNHVCTLCGKRFHSKANLRKHVKRHDASNQKATQASSNQTINENTW